MEEILTFNDPIKWDEIKEMPVQSRYKIMPMLVEQMYDHVKSKCFYWTPKRPGGIGYWNFRRLLILNDLYKEAKEGGQVQEEVDFWYKLFKAYQDRMENNYAKYSPSVQHYKHKFRNTYEKKYSNKDKQDNKEE